jgi:hypothetical protein
MRETDERWKELCRQAAVEKDPQRLSELVREITNLLSPDNSSEAQKQKSQAGG